MSIRHSILLIAAAACVSTAAPAQARQAQPQAQSQQPPEAKPEAAPSVAGKWNMSVDTPNGAVDATLDLKIDGKKVAGTIASQVGEAKIEGEFADGKLTFWFTMDANGQQLNITVKGAPQKDGSLAGTMDFGQGEMTWKGTKAK
jgi:hypothetical protein